MSWEVPPHPYFFESFVYAAGVEYAYISPPASEVTISCPRPAPATDTDDGIVPQTFTGTDPFPILAAVAQVGLGPSGEDLTAGDYRFSIALTVDSDIGVGDGGYTACITPPSIFETSQLTGYEDGYTTGDVDAPVVDVNTGVPTDVNSGLFGAGLSAFLVNPDTAWPTPDVFGNTAGTVLWTYEQLPDAAASLAWEVHWTGELPKQIELQVVIAAYWVERLPQPAWMCVL